MSEHKMSKAEEKNLEEKILQTDRPSLLDHLNIKNSAACRVNCRKISYLIKLLS